MLRFDRLDLRQGAFRLTADLTIAKGDRVTVMGPSGAGKSTLLAAIGGFFAPASGAIVWDGHAIDGLPPGQRPVSTIFQDNNLFPHLTLFQNTAMGVRPSGRASAAETAQIHEALEAVGLSGMGARKPATLSGGQQSRAALARMLVQARPIVLLDEPFSALGPALRAEMIGLVTALCDRTEATLLMVSHDPGDALLLGGDLMLVAESVVHPPEEAAGALAAPGPALAAYLGPTRPG
ncbi:ATP-binding cassette domain-containing protein [Oceaniglobus indicus]|uniref:thiamine ABC transporter ATP-binding protein n=1 Tax=Oceaniglobus indicus TaxID=2047749 RepID=UPI000C1995DC|nr:ATP-binding cassette domain-containing protein [Oceaniglobus indicus]